MNKGSDHGKKKPLDNLPGTREKISLPDDFSLEVSGIIHDLKTVLATISGYAELIREELPPGSPARAKTGKIISGVLKSSLLVDEIGILGKYPEKEDHEIDAAKILHECVDFINTSLSGNTRITVEIPDKPVVVTGTRLQLFRVFMNVITNAARSMVGTGGEITAGLFIAPAEEVKNIFSNLTDDSNHVIIYFKDTGPGMDRQVLDRMFEPYFTTGEITGGSGLGLTVVKRIVNELNGKINVISQQGKGTEFYICFPLIK